MVLIGYGKSVPHKRGAPRGCSRWSSARGGATAEKDSRITWQGMKDTNSSSVPSQ
jgi:hypothetical protein